MGDWKYISPGTVRTRGGIGIWHTQSVAEPGMLFYLPEDPQEDHDVASLYPEVVESVRKAYTSVVGDATKSNRDALGGAD